MTTSKYLSLRVLLLFLMQTSPRCTQSCLILEFEDVSDRLTALLGSVVNITFYLNTQQCLQTQITHKIRISNESSRDIFCDFQPSENCTAKIYRQAFCSCLTPKRTMLFSKKVSVEDNNTVYLWRLWDTNLEEHETKRITFHTYSETQTTSSKQVIRGETQTTSSKQVIRDAGTTTGEVKALESKSELALIYHSKVVVIISATFCVCLVVISVAVATGVVCYKRARTLHYRPETYTDMNTFAYLNYALEGVNSSRHQARDIYEEIPDPPKKNRRSRVDSTASSKLGVKLPPIPVEDATTQGPTKGVQLSNDFDGYLHPALISDATPLETREFRDNPTVQSS